MKDKLKRFWRWFIHLFVDEFEITVYRQSEGGHMYRSNYNAKRIFEWQYGEDQKTIFIIRRKIYNAFNGFQILLK